LEASSFAPADGAFGELIELRTDRAPSIAVADDMPKVHDEGLKAFFDPGRSQTVSAMLRDTKMVNARVSLRTCAYNFNIFESRKRNRRFPPQLMAFSAGLRGDFAGDPGRARTCDLPLRRRLRELWKPSERSDRCPLFRVRSIKNETRCETQKANRLGRNY